MKPVYSIVVPIYNEEAVLPILLRRLDALLDQLDGPAETILVDDGSSDTGAIFREAKAHADHRCRYISLSRNFGRQIAITTSMPRSPLKLWASRCSMPLASRPRSPRRSF